MGAQAIGDGIIVADAVAKPQHIGPARGLLVRGSRVLRQSGAGRGKQDQDEAGAHGVAPVIRLVKDNCQGAF